jgi:hypothetical protein
MNKIVFLDGGIGRVLCSTRAVDQLAKSGPVSVITPWVECFQFNPNVEAVYHSADSNLFETVIKDGDFIYPEPYHRRSYYSGRDHLARVFADDLGVSIDQTNPSLYLEPSEGAWASEFVNEVRHKTGRKKIVAVQLFGAGAKPSPMGVVDPSNRSLSTDAVIYLVEKLVSDPDVIVVNCSHIEMPLPCVWLYQFTLRQLFAFVSLADAVVTVDSCLSHTSAAYGKPGALLLGATRKENVAHGNLKVYQREGFPKHYSTNRTETWGRCCLMQWLWIR